MSEQETRRIIRQYQKAKKNSIMRLQYLNYFVPKMIYRTTKTENAGTSRRMVHRVLKSLS